ncbi:MAG: hypothetical protein ACM3JC_12720 [Rudaea sp.]
MKQTLVACAIAGAFCVAAAGAQAQARGGGDHRGNWSGGDHRGNWSSGHGGNWSGGHRADWGRHDGGHYRGRYYGGRDHGRFYGFGSLYLGWPGYYWPYYGPPVYYDYPAYTYYDYPVDEVYIERVPSSAPPAPPAQYYCPNAGYYPTVKTCPQGWLRVVPDAPPPE